MRESSKEPSDDAASDDTNSPPSQHSSNEIENSFIQNQNSLTSSSNQFMKELLQAKELQKYL